MNRLLYFLIPIAVSILIAGCQKEEELLEGVWQRVFIDGIERDYTREWHFFDNQLIIKDVYDTGEDKVTEFHGIYRLKPVFNKTYIALKDIPDHADFITYNTTWQVLSLNNDILVIIHYDDGGVLQREFIKIE